VVIWLVSTLPNVSSNFDETHFAPVTAGYLNNLSDRGKNKSLIIWLVISVLGNFANK
jgi:hypothetical protein